MTNEERADDLIRAIVCKAKQNKLAKKEIRELEDLAAKDETVRRMYNYFLSSLDSRSEDL